MAVLSNAALFLAVCAALALGWRLWERYRGPKGPHAYTSTACGHDLHHRCRRTCKFCDAPCECPCHVPTTTQEAS